MSEYWKSTPKYWCKFCQVYVRDTGLERRNHEASGKHQGAIQRSLRELHKGKAREEREQQTAKSEVARLNRIVGGKTTTIKTLDADPVSRPAPARAPAPSRPTMDHASHLRAQAQQLIAMGMELPDELKQQISGSGEWQVTSYRVVEEDRADSGGKDSSLPAIKGVHKRKPEDGEDDSHEDQPKNKRKVWGSTLKSYPDQNNTDDADQADLDVLLSGVSKKQSVSATTIDDEAEPAEDSSQIKAADAIDATEDAEVKAEDEGAVTAPPVVMFKKRKGKR